MKYHSLFGYFLPSWWFSLDFNAKGPGSAQIERKGWESAPSMAADKTERGALPIANEVTSSNTVRNGGAK